jgi:hypothetical protein
MEAPIVVGSNNIAVACSNAYSIVSEGIACLVKNCECRCPGRDPPLIWQGNGLRAILPRGLVSLKRLESPRVEHQRVYWALFAADVVTL